MNPFTRCACTTAALAFAVSTAVAEMDVGSVPRGQVVRILPDSAAGRVVATVYEGRFSWVRIETRESGAAPNQHPFDVTAAALRAMLGRVQLVQGQGTTTLFTARQLDEISAPLAAALGRASIEQDVSFAVSDQVGLLGPLASRAVTTARVFRRDGQLQLIAGLVRRDFESQFRGSGVLIAFEPGRRAQPVERDVRLSVPAGGGSSVRDDWIALSTGETASAPAAAAVSAARPGASTAATAGGKDADELHRRTAERLRALDKLRKDGLITEAEYQEKRRQILREL